MAVVNLSIFINGCLDDASSWHDTAGNALVELLYHHDENPTYIGGTDIGSARFPNTTLLWKYQLTDSPYMAEITEYPNLEFCECADRRGELDNETGIFDPSIADWCMACDNAMPGDDPNA